MKAKTRKVLGVLFIVSPGVVFLTVMLFWPIIAGLVVSFSSRETIVALTSIVNMVNIILGLLGWLSIVMMPIGLVVGIILLLKKDNNVKKEVVGDAEQQYSSTNENTMVNKVDVGDTGDKV